MPKKLTDSLTNNDKNFQYCVVSYWLLQARNPCPHHCQTCINNNNNNKKTHTNTHTEPIIPFPIITNHLKPWWLCRLKYWLWRPIYTDHYHVIEHLMCYFILVLAYMIAVVLGAKCLLKKLTKHKHDICGLLKVCHVYVKKLKKISLRNLHFKCLICA